MSNANEVYVDNGVQYGSKKETIKRPAGNGDYTRANATPVGTYILDSITINRAVKKVEQSDEVGGPNGFAMVNAQVDGSCVVQIGPVANNWPRNGDFFEDTLDPALGSERFVLGPISDPFEVNGYFKANATLTKAHFAA